MSSPGFNYEQNQPSQGMMHDHHHSNLRGQNSRGGSRGNRGGRGGHSHFGPRHNSQNNGYASNSISSVQENANPRYKGKNYNPNYQQKKNSAGQSKQAKHQHPWTFAVNTDGDEISYQDSHGDTIMLDGTYFELQKKYRTLEHRYGALRADTKLFLEVMAQGEGREKIEAYLNHSTEARIESPFAEIVQQVVYETSQKHQSFTLHLPYCDDIDNIH